MSRTCYLPLLKRTLYHLSYWKWAVNGLTKNACLCTSTSLSRPLLSFPSKKIRHFTRNHCCLQMVLLTTPTSSRLSKLYIPIALKARKPAKLHLFYSKLDFRVPGHFDPSQVKFILKTQILKPQKGGQCCFPVNSYLSQLVP